MSDQPVVLVVEDEPDVAATYELWLQDDHVVRLAEDGSTALEQVDEDVDGDPDGLWVVDCSGSTGKGSFADSDRVKYVANPGDLTGLGIGLAKAT